MIEDLIFKDECYKIVGLAMKVHSKLGKGFKEVVYKDALEIEFKNNQVPYEREKPFAIEYEGIILAHRFDADFSFIIQSLLRQKQQYNSIMITLNKR